MAKIMKPTGKPVFFSIFGVLILLLGASGIVFYRSNEKLQEQVFRAVYPSPCDQPFQFKIGSVDEKFGISPEELKKQSLKASLIWNRAYGEDLFVFDKKAELTVNLVFDKRQELTNEIGEISEKITDTGDRLKPEIASHQNLVAEFEKKKKDFSERVKYWNNRGGAPEEEFNKLISEQASLKQEADQLNERAKTLNQSAVAFNSDVTNYNETVSEFNIALKQKPEEGIYDGKKKAITLFFYINDPELVHTIAHEFGHAIGMQHVLNSESVMFSKTNQTITPSKKDLSELSRVCKREPIWETLRNRYLQPSKSS